MWTTIKRCAPSTTVGKVTRKSIAPSTMRANACTVPSRSSTSIQAGCMYSTTRCFSSAASSSSHTMHTPSTPVHTLTSVSSNDPFISSLVQGILTGDRLSLSKAITLVESQHEHHSKQAAELMNFLAEQKRQQQGERDRRQKEMQALLNSMTPEQRAEAELTKPRALRIGISGPPGVGKSTFIEFFGQYLLSLGHRLAVLSIDPSSHVSGGSILGDKTRMLELSRNDNAYVRPSPSRCVLGGVGSNTFDAILLCEAAGFDLVFVETVGVGQSEVSVADMVDMLILLVQPGGGDELQGMKKGIVELIDLIIVNKADGPLLSNARHTKLEYMHALQLNTRRKKDTDWKPVVKLCSSVSDSSVAQADYCTPAPTAPAPEHQQDQIKEIWKTIGQFEEWARGPKGDFSLRRSRQSKSLVHQALQDHVTLLLNRALPQLESYQALQARWQEQEKAAKRKFGHATTDAIHSGVELVPRVEAQKIVEEWFKKQSKQE